MIPSLKKHSNETPLSADAAFLTASPLFFQGVARGVVRRTRRAHSDRVPCLAYMVAIKHLADTQHYAFGRIAIIISYDLASFR